MSVKGVRPVKEIKPISHKELCKSAASWLQNSIGCGVVARELTTAAGEIPDAFGVKSGVCYLVECKSSRSDFLVDSKKYFRRNPEQGLGSFRYYMCPAGLILPEEVPEKWGLLWRYDKMISRAKEAVYQDSDQRSEIILLSSIIRRLEISSCVFVTREVEEEKECSSDQITCGTNIQFIRPQILEETAR